MRVRFTSLLGLLVLLGLVPFASQAQFAQDWRFGFSARMILNPAPSGATGSVLFSEDGSACITAPSGQMLFYTAGDSVFNRQNVAMANGRGLMGFRGVTQSSLIVPFPKRNGRYLLFTLARTTDTSGLRYNVIDMNLAGGLGAIVNGQKNLLLLQGAPVNQLTEKMTAVQHCNGDDYWVVVHRYNSNEFIVYPVDSTGVGTPIFQQVGTPHTPAIGTTPQRAQRGYMVFSPDGHRLALTLNGPNANNLIEVFDFDKNTGTISNPLTLPARGGEYGLAFSPSSARLFVSGARDTTIGGNIGADNHISVFDMIARDPAATKTLVTRKVLSVSRRFGALQNAPGGRIYSVLSLTDALNSINNPGEEPYDFRDSTIFPLNGTTRLGLPNFLNDEFKLPFEANFGYDFACFGQPMNFVDSSRSNAKTWMWNFGDAAAGGNDTSSLQYPSYSFPAPGTYTVTLIAGDPCGLMDTISKQVEVGINLPVDLGNDTVFVCIGDSATLSSNIPNAQYVWSTGQPGGPWVALPNDTLQRFTTQVSGWIKLDVDNGSCSGTDSVFVFVNNSPISVNLGGSVSLCIGETVLVDAGIPNASYSWSTGETTQTINVSQADTIWVLVNDRGCIATDTLYVSIDTLNAINVMNDTTLCPGDPLVIDASAFGIGFQWSTGETTASITVLDTGVYLVDVTNSLGCVVSDTIIVRYRCDTKVFIPTAFTPNGDGLNDEFKPIVQSVDEGMYSFQVYNRWGQLVFETNNPDVGWNGEQFGREAEEGIYTYLVRFFTNVQRVNTFESGPFWLLR